jgi:hypothetical protein
MSIVEEWRKTFLQVVRRSQYADPLRETSIAARLGEWTKTLTGTVVTSCEEMDWSATAKGHRLELLPVSRSEYLALDVMAFPAGEKRWRFPAAIFELENSKDDDRIAYSLWKVLSVNASLRVVFCYRQQAEDGGQLIRFLQDDVIKAMQLTGRMALEGETLVVVGSRSDSDTFPYGFFRWWRLNTNTGAFSIL